MPTVSLTTEQVTDLVRQLPPAQKRAVLTALALDAHSRREERRSVAEARIRELAAARGYDWDAMDEDAREMFIDDLLHEDR